MKNLETFEKKYLEKNKQTKKIPNFNSGDTVIVYVKVKEKKRERDQAFEGVCISKKNAGINSSFTVRKISYGITSKLEPLAKKISIVLFILVLLGAIAAERENVVSYFAQAGLITLVLNVVMMIVAYCVAQLLASGTKQKKCITIECGLQNGTLAIFVAISIFGGGMYVIPAATYSLIMFATSLIFVYLVKKVS